MCHYIAKLPIRLSNERPCKDNNWLLNFVNVNWCNFLQVFCQPGPYSQRIILFVTNKWAQIAKVLHYTRLERLARGKQFNLLDSFVSYEKNEMV
jgi:hypothetical protein